jgi:hypothetical protein
MGAAYQIGGSRPRVGPFRFVSRKKKTGYVKYRVEIPSCLPANGFSKGVESLFPERLPLLIGVIAERGNLNVTKH